MDDSQNAPSTNGGTTHRRFDPRGPAEQLRTAAANATQLLEHRRLELELELAELRSKARR